MPAKTSPPLMNRSQQRQLEAIGMAPTTVKGDMDKKKKKRKKRKKTKIRVPYYR